MEQDYDYDDLTDALIEDTFWWDCPKCTANNRGLCGDEELTCWQCKSSYEIDDDGEMRKL